MTVPAGAQHARKTLWFEQEARAWAFDPRGLGYVHAAQEAAWLRLALTEIVRQRESVLALSSRVEQLETALEVIRPRVLHDAPKEEWDDEAQQFLIPLDPETGKAMECAWGCWVCAAYRVVEPLASVSAGEPT